MTISKKGGGLIAINEQIPKNAQNHPITVKRHLERELTVKHNF